MAGWRAREGGDSDVQPVEILTTGEDGSSVTDVDAGRSLDWHAVLRTGAAVLAAASLLWVGRSVADQAQADRHQQCMAEVERTFWRYEQRSYNSGGRPEDGEVFTTAVMDDLIAHARACGADAYADALDRTRPDADDG